MNLVPVAVYWCLLGLNSLLKLSPPLSWLLQQLSVYHPLTTHKPQYTKAQYCVSSMCQDFKQILSSPPQKSTLKRSRCDVCAYVCVVSVKTSVSAWPGCQAKAALQIPPCWHTVLRSCQHHSTTGYRGSHSHYELPMFRDKSAYRYLFPCLCLCVRLHLCVCVFKRVRETQGGNAEELREVETSLIVPNLLERANERGSCLLTWFFLFLSWLRAFTRFFSSCFMLIQSNRLTAGSFSGHNSFL